MKEKNPIYLTEQGSVLTQKGQRLLVRHREKGKIDIPLHHIDRIAIFGNIQITTQAERLCLINQVPIFLLSSTGKYLGAIRGESCRQVVLRKKQYLKSEDPSFCLSLAQEIVRAKIHNSRIFLLRLNRQNRLLISKEAISQLGKFLILAIRCKTLDSLRGIEGSAARYYFQALAQALPPDFKMPGRNSRPPKDPVNALLSLGYVLLTGIVNSCLRMSGLDPAAGFFHQGRTGTPNLALDMVEEWRAVIVDPIVLGMLNLKVLHIGDFIFSDEDGVYLEKPALRKFLSYFERRMGGEDGFFKRIDQQVWRLSSALEQDKVYQAYRWK